MRVELILPYGIKLTSVTSEEWQQFQDGKINFWADYNRVYLAPSFNPKKVLRNL